MMPCVAVQKYRGILARSVAQQYRAVKQAVVMVGLVVLATVWLQAQDALQIDNKGNVGIGTKSPSALLQVGSGEPNPDFGGKTTVGVVQRSSDTVGVSIRALETKEKPKDPPKRIPTLQFCNVDACDYLKMLTDGSLGIGSSDEKGVRVQADGNAIIQTDKDSAELVLRTAKNTGLALQYMSTMVGNQTKQRIGFKGLKNMTLWSEANTGNAFVYGNLGVGAEAPEAKLQVAGDGKFSGNVQIGKAIRLTEGGGELRLQYKKEGNSDRIGFADGDGNWLSWSEYQTGSSYIKGDLTITGKLILPNGWAISTGQESGHPALLFSRNNDAKMAIREGGSLGYKVTDAGLWDLNWTEERGYKWTYWGSDVRLKTDLRPISSALEKVNKLNGITYRWNQAALDYFTRDIEQTISAGPDATPQANQKLWQAERTKRFKELSNANAGIVAQDVEAVLPEAVSTDEAGYKHVAYHELIPLLIEALKEEDRTSKEQAQTIAHQQLEIRRLAAANESAQQQLLELRELKQRLVHVESMVDTVMHTGLEAASDGRPLLPPIQ